MKYTISCALFLLFGLHSGANADVTLNPLFSDHMVLQRDRPVPVWGKADPGEAVAVSFAAQTERTTVGADGKWMVFLHPLAVSADPRSLTVQGKNEITLSDVLVGDVWLGSGQSNMDYTVNGTDRGEAIKRMPAGTFDGIRLFLVGQATADEPQDTVASGSWLLPSTDNIMRFSAVMFYFGEELHKKLPGVPLGLIRSSVGATNLYCWIPNEVRDQDNSAEYVRTWWANVVKGWSPDKQAARDQEMVSYQAAVDAAKQTLAKLPDGLKKPDELTGPKWSRRPSGLYNGMIAPLQPLAMRGLIWYQGEWDCKHDWQPVYGDLFVAGFKSWRDHWVQASGKTGSGDFPIYIVQLPARDPADENSRYWAPMRETEQRLAGIVPNSGYVVTFETNDPTNMHPHEKTPVGQRLAWLALGKEYGQNLAWHGPELKSAQPSAGGMLLEFNPGSDSLVSTDGAKLRWFELAGPDGIYHAADAEIRGGNQVFVSSTEVANPLTVRYAFAPAPEKPNFYNSAGLPTGPFRTDQQPAVDSKS